jgi:hypothetical protein
VQIAYSLQGFTGIYYRDLLGLKNGSKEAFAVLTLSFVCPFTGATCLPVETWCCRKTTSVPLPEYVVTYPFFAYNLLDCLSLLS